MLYTLTDMKLRLAFGRLAGTKSTSWLIKRLSCYTTAKQMKLDGIHGAGSMDVYINCSDVVEDPHEPSLTYRRKSAHSSVLSPPRAMLPQCPLSV